MAYFTYPFIARLNGLRITRSVWASALKYLSFYLRSYQLHSLQFIASTVIALVDVERTNSCEGDDKERHRRKSPTQQKAKAW